MGHETIGRDNSERVTDAHPDPAEANLFPANPQTVYI